MSGQIFISYRREESRWSAGRLFDRLTARFDRRQIFMDIDGIGLGEDFVETIEKRVGACDVLIAIIGARRLTSTDQQGVKRIENPKDFVRMEVGTALRRNIRVIPVLVDGVSMPQPADLPDDLKDLTYRNALEIGDSHFDDDCRRLREAIEEVLEEKTAELARQEKERVENESQVQPPAVAPSTASDRSKADETPGGAPKVNPLGTKPAEAVRLPSDGVAGKSPSKRLIAFVAIGAFAAVCGVLVYLGIKAPHSPSKPSAPIAALTPSPPAIATPIVE
jgi:TIR domain